MNTIMVIVFKVLFPHGPTNVSNIGKGVLVPCRVPPLSPRQGLGCDRLHMYLILMHQAC